MNARSIARERVDEEAISNPPNSGAIIGTFVNLKTACRTIHMRYRGLTNFSLYTGTRPRVRDVTDVPATANVKARHGHKGREKGALVLSGTGTARFSYRQRYTYAKIL